MASGSASLWPHRGTRRFPRMTSRTWVSRRRPRGYRPDAKRAKSSGEAAGVEERHHQGVAEGQRRGGAGRRRQVVGQASWATPASRWTIGLPARDDAALPVMAMSLAPWRLTGGRCAPVRRIRRFEGQTGTSSRVIMPRSPWLASAG